MKISARTLLFPPGVSAEPDAAVPAVEPGPGATGPGSANPSTPTAGQIYRWAAGWLGAVMLAVAACLMVGNAAHPDRAQVAPSGVNAVVRLNAEFVPEVETSASGVFRRTPDAGIWAAGSEVPQLPDPGGPTNPRGGGT